LTFYLAWAFSGQRLDFYYYVLTQNPAECENCSLNVDEPMDTPANRQ
jgi:hypothetical protein